MSGPARRGSTPEGVRQAASLLARRLRGLAAVPGPDPRAPVGPLPADVAAALTAVTESLLSPVAPPASGYVAALRWRAEHVPGHLALYRSFTRLADAESRRRGARDFATAPPPVRLEVLRRATAARAEGGSPLRRARAVVLDRRWAGVDRYVLRPVLVRFAATDAWTAVGYPERPGSPRDLAAAQTPPGDLGGRP